MVNGAVFDMDGLMIDSERIVFENWVEIMERRGYEFGKDIFCRTIGMRRAETERTLKELYGDDFPFLDIAEECHYLFIEKTKDGMPVKKGLPEILDFFEERGVPLAVATSTRRKSAERALSLAGVIDRFDAIICGEDVTRGKPDPEIFLTASALIGAPPAECAVFEDSINGVRAAHSAGMITVMIPDMQQPPEDIISQVDILCNSLLDAIKYFNK